MAYNVTHSDGITPLVTLLDGEIDTTSTDLVLLGKNYLGYGELVADNFVKIIENFAGKPRDQLNALRGQLYYNIATSQLQLHTGLDYTVGSPNWKNITAFSDGNGIFEADIMDIHSQSHKCIKITINNVLVAVLSVDADFTPHANENLGAFCGVGATPTPTDGVWDTNYTIGKGLNLNSSSDFKIRGVAVEAEFADVAEIYVGDASYEPGTLVSLGGEAEVTQTLNEAETNIFGIVSTRPAYLLNTRAKGKKNALPIAVAGRIPVKVTGTIKRGDRLIASNVPGVAQAAPADVASWAIVGRSLGEFSGEGIGKVEATVGVR